MLSIIKEMEILAKRLNDENFSSTYEKINAFNRFDELEKRIKKEYKIHIGKINEMQKELIDVQEIARKYKIKLT